MRTLLRLAVDAATHGLWLANHYTTNKGRAR